MVLGLVSVVAEVIAGGSVSSIREVNSGSANEYFPSMAVVLRLVSVVAEVNTGCGSGVVTELGVINGISDRFVSPMLLFERALTIIITATATHIIAITVIETAVVVAVVMEFTMRIMVFVVVVLVVVGEVLVVVVAVVVDVMVLAVVVVAAVVVGTMVFVVVVFVVVAALPVMVVVVAAVVVHAVNDIDPDEPVNMLRVFAFEFTQETPQSI